MEVHAEAIKWRLFLLGVVSPLTAVSIGVDGGDIFQILAVETLALDPRAVGTALLFGALSIPVQIWAARIPLTRARHNIRIFLVLLGLIALITAALVLTASPGSPLAASVLVLAVVAEIAVSVLYATSWQPLIAYTLTVEQRQFVNGRGRAITGLALLGSAVLFGQLGDTGRAVFLVALAAGVIAVAWSLHILPPPPSPTSVASSPTLDDAGTPDSAANTASSDSTDSGAGTDTNQGGSLTNVFLSLPATAFASWPLLVSYAVVSMGPEVNLGLLAGAMALGGVVASLLWRDPKHRLIMLIRLASAGIAICSAVIVLLGPVASTAAFAVLLVTVTLGTASRTALRTAVMELAHRRIDPTNSVRVMTMIDVVGSTSFQVGAFVAGFLIAAGTEPAVSGLPVDPYQIWLLTTSVLLLAAAARFRPNQRIREPETAPAP